MCQSQKQICNVIIIIIVIVIIIISNSSRKQLTTRFSTDFSFDVVSAKDRLFELKTMHGEEWHTERLQSVFHILAVEDHLQTPAVGGMT